MLSIKKSVSAFAIFTVFCIALFGCSPEGVDENDFSPSDNEQSFSLEIENANNSQLLFNGIYQLTFEDGWTNYLRFYEDGSAHVVISNTASTVEVASWFRDGHESAVLGSYQITGNEIIAEFPNPELSAQYSGEILDNSLSLNGVLGDVSFDGVFEFVSVE